MIFTTSIIFEERGKCSWGSVGVSADQAKCINRLHTCTIMQTKTSLNEADNRLSPLLPVVAGGVGCLGEGTDMRSNERRDGN